MASITITISDLPYSHVQVSTDADRPVVGRGVTPAQGLALELLGTAFKRGHQVVYDSQQVPAIALALELLDPEGFGFTVAPEVRDRARIALGRQATERKAMDGVDIDAVHRRRGNSDAERPPTLRSLIEELRNRCDDAEIKGDGRVSTAALRPIYQRALEVLS